MGADAEALPARLRRLRTAAGLSAIRLSQAAGLRPKAVSQYEAGQAVPRLGTILQLAAVLKVDAGVLGFGEGGVPGATCGPPDDRGLAGLPARLRLARTLAGISVLVLARRSEVLNTALGPWELGAVDPAELLPDAVGRVARALGVCPAWLAFGVPLRPSP